MDAFQENTSGDLPPQIRALMDSYFAAYSFNGSVIAKAEPLLRERNRGKFKSPHGDLRQFYTHPERERIGIPQGSSISLQLVNLLMTSVDRATETTDPRQLYLRYCDDMIILHTDRDICADQFERYGDELRRLKLPAHSPVEYAKYDGAFWKGKSKAPYCWTSESVPLALAVPWLSFVGYQIHARGHVRIRFGSVKKERDKQERIVRSVIGRLRSVKQLAAGRIKRHKESIIFRVQQRLIAMAIGRRRIHSRLDGALAGPSWAQGFQLLAEFPPPTRQLHELDRSREGHLRRLRRLLGRFGRIDVPGTGRRPIREKFYGRPFSYAGQFIHRTYVARMLAPRWAWLIKRFSSSVRELLQQRVLQFFRTIG